MKSRKKEMGGKKGRKMEKERKNILTKFILSRLAYPLQHTLVTKTFVR